MKSSVSIFSLLSFSYYPAQSFPDDSVLVVRTDALQRFQEQLEKDDVGKQEKPYSFNERRSHLILIASLLDYSAIDMNERGAAVDIAKITEEYGDPLSDDTVRRVLEKIGKTTKDPN